MSPMFLLLSEVLPPFFKLSSFCRENFLTMHKIVVTGFLISLSLCLMKPSLKPFSPFWHWLGKIQAEIFAFLLSYALIHPHLNPVSSCLSLTCSSLVLWSKICLLGCLSRQQHPQLLSKLQLGFLKVCEKPTTIHWVQTTCSFPLFFPRWASSVGCSQEASSHPCCALRRCYCLATSGFSTL